MALKVFRQENPDVTFMDISMPGMNGLECLTEIRKVDPKAVVIMFSALINPELEKEARALGALMAIKKPPTRESIQEALEKAERARG